MEQNGCSGIRDFARRTGLDHSVVARRLRILKLPDEVLAFLGENQTPEILRAYRVKRLATLSRLPGEQCLVRFFTDAHPQRE